MQYKRFGNIITARMDLDEEILEQLEVIAKRENIKLAQINALGAVKDFTVGVLKPAEQKFYPNTFKGTYEIVSLHGNITTMNGEYYAHLHMSAGDENGHVVGGHLNRAVIGATCEMFIEVIDGSVEREKDPEIGINILKF